MEKTANINSLPFSVCVTTSADAFLYEGKVWAHHQLSSLWRNTRKEPNFTRREQPSISAQSSPKAHLYS